MAIACNKQLIGAAGRMPLDLFYDSGYVEMGQGEVERKCESGLEDNKTKVFIYVKARRKKVCV